MKKRNSLYYLAFLALAFGACAQNDLDTEKTVPGYEEVPFEFNLTTSSMEVFSKTDSEMDEDIDTRTIAVVGKKTVKKQVVDDASCIDVAIGSDVGTRAPVAPTTDEKKITDICIFQFDGVGDANKLLHKEYVGSGSTTINASLAASGASNAVYIVANVGDITASYIAGTTTLADFKKAACDITVNSAKGLPMIGSQNVDMTTATSVSVSLNFMVAKLKFTCTNAMPASVGTFTYKSIQLKGVPTQSTMLAATAEPAVITSLGVINENVDNNAIDGKEFIWYVPENMSGNVSGLTVYQRGDYKAPAKSMYIEILGQFKPQGAAVGDEASAITYQVYLGANNTTNFDVARNKQYTITAGIKGINATDNRIVIGEDLSNAGKEVANCYIALKKNYWYRFYGKVQGNGRGLAGYDKYPVDDFVADLTGTVGAEKLPGRAITAALLNPREAFVVWQTSDVENVGGNVISSAFWSDRGYVVFRTGGDVEGNAVIGVREAATAADAVAWSWHIWKTANDPRSLVDEFKVRNNTQADGWTATTNPVWNPHTEKSMKRNLGAANNTPKDKLAGGLLYQWGRKDPFIGSADFAAKSTAPYPTVVHRSAFNWKDGSNHGAGVATAKDPKEVDAVGGLTTEKYAIAHPTHFLIQYNATTYDWYAAARKDQNDNLWGNPNRTAAPSQSQLPNQERGIKSIYDPCPYGWRVAPQDTWTSFTKTVTTKFGGNNYGSGDCANWNVVGNEGANVPLATLQTKFTDDVGWTFYYERDGDGKTVYFPASGYRSSGSGVFDFVSTNGYGWSTSPYGSSTVWGGYLSFYSGSVNPLNYTNRGHSFPVRCVQE